MNLQILKAMAQANVSTVSMTTDTMDALHIAPYRRFARAGWMRLDVKKTDDRFRVDAHLTDTGHQMLASYRARGCTLPIVRESKPVALKIQWSERGVSSDEYPITRIVGNVYYVDIRGGATLPMRSTDKRIAQVIAA